MADNSSNTGNPPLIINIPAWTGQVGPEFGPIVTIKIIFDSGRPIDEAAGDRPDTAEPATESVNDSADITTTGPVAEPVAEDISEITTRTATRLVIDSAADSATEPINESDNVSSDSTTADAATEPAAETAANSVNDSTNVNLETAIFLVHQHRICNASPYLKQVFDSKPQARWGLGPS
ncbi:hypothetical protein M430DRAFT_27346 [Amorphotheca resinae ATCC 22711]|uniref:Uncharacterized protein n=1 Tax=Amorphotheca resinae ATCC 22711 TaxID=857342 RepID=A0A2T3B3S6_AMORE|nr:hypothetical protein M430DRAFT_27346 [Amorphotheca resinae ATCC 22711]PSS20287.1 hypothetical protein M430DRAFT_27346 [Amorphotheca resinae ATCC 22711]